MRREITFELEQASIERGSATYHWACACGESGLGYDTTHVCRIEQTYADGLREGYRRGQEAMRERAANVPPQVSDGEDPFCCQPLAAAIASAIRALPLEELPE